MTQINTGGILTLADASAQRIRTGGILTLADASAQRARTGGILMLADASAQRVRTGGILILVNAIEGVAGITVGQRLRHGGGLVDGVLYPFGSEA